MTDIEWLSTEEAAGILRVHPETIRRHADALDGFKLGGVWRFPASCVQARKRLRDDILATMADSPEAVA